MQAVPGDIPHKALVQGVHIRRQQGQANGVGRKPAGGAALPQGKAASGRGFLVVHQQAKHPVGARQHKQNMVRYLLVHQLGHLAVQRVTRQPDAEHFNFLYPLPGGKVHRLRR